MQTEQQHENVIRGPFEPSDDRNIKIVRKIAADAIAQRRASSVPGPLICMYYAKQPGAKILPGGVVELPN